MMPIHPLIVHFPIALLISALILSMIALFLRSKQEMFINIVFWNLLLGTIGSVAAVFSGLLQEDSLIHNNSIHEVLEVHKLLAIILTVLFIGLLIWFGLRKIKMKRIELFSFVLVLLISTGILGYTSHLGGQMVYEMGAGIIPMEIHLQDQPHDHNSGDHNHNKEDKHKEHNH